MGAVVALDSLLDQRRLWKGQPQARPSGSQSTGHARSEE
ncbi:MAG TPA: DNA lesion error-prone repair protein ImuA, partial [Pseudomonas sp.]|nr:DNA lesion error-prone repair protein ImuA [Pseudomonas sp.]